MVVAVVGLSDSLFNCDHIYIYTALLYNENYQRKLTNALIMANINKHNIKYISKESSRLEAPTVANGIELTLVRSSTHNRPATMSLALKTRQRS